ANGRTSFCLSTFFSPLQHVQVLSDRHLGQTSWVEERSRNEAALRQKLEPFRFPAVIEMSRYVVSCSTDPFEITVRTTRLIRGLLTGEAPHKAEGASPKPAPSPKLRGKERRGSCRSLCAGTELRPTP